MKAKRNNEVELSVDMTPMIDMVFLLLVFFMIAATMSKVDMTPEIKLPVAPKSQVPEDLRNRGTINILPLGATTPAGAVVSAERPFLLHGQLVNEQELKQQIDAVRKGTPELRVYMRIDKNVEFASVQRAIKACADVGVFDIVFATYQSGGGE
jgi:biopolymer transport protein ExbD